jgi:hypothetical protein
MQDEDAPDFEALASAWVGNDARLREVQPAQAQGLVERLAEALRKRREAVAQAEPQDGRLVVNIDRSRLDPKTGLDPQALDELARLIEEADD